MHLLQNSKCYKEGPTLLCLLALCTMKWQCPISFPGQEKPFVLCTVAIIRLKKIWRTSELFKEAGGCHIVPEVLGQKSELKNQEIAGSSLFYSRVGMGTAKL